MKDQNKNKSSNLTDKSKSNKKDISNSLEQDATKTPLKGKQTPQGRTDNELDRERKNK